MSLDRSGWFDHSEPEIGEDGARPAGSVSPGSRAAPLPERPAKLHEFTPEADAESGAADEADDPPDQASGGRYGEGGANPLAVGVTILVHVLLGFALLQMGAKFTHVNVERLVAVDLRPAPPPEPETPADVPPPSPRQEVVAAQPAIDLPRPDSVKVEIAPVQLTTQPSAPVVSVPSAPGPAAPAPSPVAAPVPAIVDASDLGVRMISAEPPRYPRESRRKKEEGTVILAVTVGLEGRVADIAVSQSSGFRRLDEAALDAVRRWRWEPMLRDGRPVMVRGIVPIPFVLQQRG